MYTRIKMVQKSIKCIKRIRVAQTAKLIVLIHTFRIPCARLVVEMSWHLHLLSTKKSLASHHPSRGTKQPQACSRHLEVLPGRMICKLFFHKGTRDWLFFSDFSHYIPWFLYIFDVHVSNFVGLSVFCLASFDCWDGSFAVCSAEKKYKHHKAWRTCS